jgi:hypothetical protein
MHGHAGQSKRALGTGRLVLASSGLLQHRDVTAHRRQSRAHVRCVNKLTAMCRRMMSTAGERQSLEKWRAVQSRFLA